MTTTKETRRLGRGLASLISSDLRVPDQIQEAAPPVIAHQSSLRGTPAPNRLMMISVDSIRQNPLQPRKIFDEQAINNLAASLKSKGILQPVVVRPAEKGYELVAGERRLRASKIAGLQEIPAIIRHVSDNELLEIALIENIHRSDLTPIERGAAYRAMQQRYGLTQEEIAERTGDDRTTVANYIRLLSLDSSIIELINSSRLSMGHARALLGVPDVTLQAQLAIRAVEEGLSVRQIEGAARNEKASEKPTRPDRTLRPAVANMEHLLASALGTRVKIKEGRRRHTGKIVIEYYNLDDFERILRVLGLPDEKE